MPRRIAFPDLPGFPSARCRRPDRRLPGYADRIRPEAYELKVIALRPGAVRSSSGAQLIAHGLPRPREHRYPDRVRRRRLAPGAGLRAHPALRQSVRGARAAPGERHARGRSCWPAPACSMTATATTHWACSRGIPRRLSAGAPGSGPPLRARGALLEFRRHHRRHRPVTGLDRVRTWARRWRAAPRSTWWSTTAARATSRSSPPCWKCAARRDASVRCWSSCARICAGRCRSRPSPAKRA